MGYYVNIYFQVDVAVAEEFIGGYLVYLVRGGGDSAVWSLLSAHCLHHAEYPFFEVNVLKPLAEYLCLPATATADVQVNNLLLIIIIIIINYQSC